MMIVEQKMAMADISDCESDAGASPSVSSDESSSSSGSSSSPNLKIVTDLLQTPPKKRICVNEGVTASTSSGVASTTPVSSKRRPPRRRQIIVASAEEASTSKTNLRGSQSDSNNTGKAPTATPALTRKRKRAPQKCAASDSTNKILESETQPGTTTPAETKGTRNKRRRTRSQRNKLAGKTVSSPAAIQSQIPVITDGEEEVALDAEIDRVLDEKANKNNLTATNVKSIIRHVITNNMVQKMIMSAMIKKAEAADAGGSSDDDGLVGPKMTRAKTKELLESKQFPLWPNVYSPVKVTKPVSETHMLIQHDLPEDSSGDEEYVPKEGDIGDMIHSEDESSSVASHTSDIGSPSPVVLKQKQRITRGRSQDAALSTPPSSVFKTPPPRPHSSKAHEESAICRRTRSKFPLKDTSLEDLERQLVPPDITTDMYDWGHETDNEDYLDFLKDFLNPGKNKFDGNEVDDEADPEYNVMEDDEDLHDREELRMDRAVKVPKKELTQLIAELFEPGVLSGDDMEETDLSMLTNITPLDQTSASMDASQVNVTPRVMNDTTENIGSATVSEMANSVPSELPPTTTSETVNALIDTVSVQDPLTVTIITTLPPPLFQEDDLKLLQQQMRQHIQLLAQSYVLTVTSEEDSLKTIAKTAKSMVVEIKNFANANGGTSNFRVCNLDPAWNLVNFWPHKFLQQSPIKKKILEESYISKSGVNRDVSNGGAKVDLFPRHVVKVIAENNTFVYQNLLPECYNQNNKEQRCKFFYDEDALLVRALDEFKDSKRSATYLANIISNVLLVARPTVQVYHRIRNLKKSQQYCSPTIKKYFTEGILPKPNRTIIEITEGDMQPLIQRSRENLPSTWTTLLQHLENSPNYKWEETLNTASAKFILQKGRRNQRLSKPVEVSVDDEEKVVTSTSSLPVELETIDHVFPNGTYQIENTDPNVTAIPILDSRGKPGAIILVPKFALNSMEADSNRRNLVSLTGPKPNSQLSQPIEASEAGGLGNQQETIQSASTVNIIGLQHLIRTSSRTPVKNETVLPNSGSKFPVNNKNNIQSYPRKSHDVVTGRGYHVVQPVGKPFNLEEIGGSLPAGTGFINVSTLQTPLKTKIFQKATEAETTKDEGSGSDSDRNSNVILEGTEVEVSSDEEYDPECGIRPEPDVVTLCSEDEGKTKKGDVKNLAGGNETSKNGNTSSTKTESGNCDSNNKQTNGAQRGTTTESVIQFAGSNTSGASGSGKGDDSDGENERRVGKKWNLPQDCNKDECASESKEDEHGKGEPEASLNGASVNPLECAPADVKTISYNEKNRNRSHKKTRRSTGSGIAGNRRSSKYNVTPAEYLLEDDEPSQFNEVADAYMEAYLAKVQSSTEVNHPGVYPAFVQMLMEAGEAPLVNQSELHSKVKVLFKDYPELLREFESFLDPSLDEPTVVNVAGNENSTKVSSHDETIAEMDFLQKIEKFTARCPQLKGKVLNKIKSLKEKPNLTEKDVANALEHFFDGNPVMMESFKSLLPGVYRPHSVSSAADFEVIELEMEDPPRDNNSEDIHFEVVKLPDETTVPATSTCPCVCHVRTSDPAFSSRSKHCRKCHLKFQDGKMFIHNGRVMRPVSVELTPPKPVSNNSTVSPVTAATSSRTPCNSSNQDPLRGKKEHHNNQATASKAPEFKEPDSVKLSETKKPLSSPTNHTPQAIPNAQLVNSPSLKASTSCKEECKTDITGPNGTPQEGTEVRKASNDGSSELQSGENHQPLDVEMEEGEYLEWTEEEDTDILTICQQETSLSVAFKKLVSKLPRRSYDEIKNRFDELVTLIQSESEVKEDEQQHDSKSKP